VQRLARWLFITAERSHSDSFSLTHEFLAQMVGAPRTAVTQAAAILRHKRIIEYRRGWMLIRNRQRLYDSACECVDLVQSLERPHAGRRRQRKSLAYEGKG